MNTDIEFRDYHPEDAQSLANIYYNTILQPPKQCHGRGICADF